MRRQHAAAVGSSRRMQFSLTAADAALLGVLRGLWSCADAADALRECLARQVDVEAGRLSAGRRMALHATAAGCRLARGFKRQQQGRADPPGRRVLWSQWMRADDMRRVGELLDRTGLRSMSEAVRYAIRAQGDQDAASRIDAPDGRDGNPGHDAL